MLYFKKWSPHEFLLIYLCSKFLSGSSRRIENLFDLDQINSEKSYASGSQTLNEIYLERRGNADIEPSVLKRNSSNIVSIPSEHPKNVDSQAESCVTREDPSLNTDGITEVSNFRSDQYAYNMNILDEEPAPVHNPVDFGPLFKAGHFEIMQQNCHGLTEVGTVDVDSSSNHCEREKSGEDGEDGEDDEMLGGMFAFSEEGRDLKPWTQQLLY